MRLWVFFRIAKVGTCLSFSGLYGSVFPSTTDAAFSNLFVWKSTGSIILFGISYYVCAYVKILLMMSTLTLGFLCYILIEISIARKNNKNRSEKQQSDTNRSK